MARKRLTKAELVESFFQEFRRCWRERYGRAHTEAIGKFQRDRVQQFLLAGLEPELLLGMPEKFFSDSNSWLAENEHPLNYLLKYSTKYTRRGGGSGKAKGTKPGRDRTPEEVAARAMEEAEAAIRFFSR